MVSTRSYLILLFSFKVIFPNIKIKNVNIDFFIFFFLILWYGYVAEKKENSWKIKLEILFKV